MRRKRTAVPRLRITTGYVPELPQQRRDTIALLAAAIRCGPRSWALPDFKPTRRSLRSAPPSAAGRSKRGQQPGAGAAAVPGVMERGHRREPVSDRVPPAGGAESDRAETPGPLLRGGPVGAGCRGSPRHWRGCRNPEGVAAPGARAGAASLCIVLYLGAVLQHRFSSKCHSGRG